MVMNKNVNLDNEMLVIRYNDKAVVKLSKATYYSIKYKNKK